MADAQPNTMIKNINHIAIAVNDLEAGQRFLHELMGLSLDHVARVSLMKVSIQLFGCQAAALLSYCTCLKRNGVSKFWRNAGIHHML